MDYDFWQTRWAEGHIGFHQEKGNAKLREHWRDFLRWWHPTKSGAPRVLVPLCGKTPDLAWLGAQALEVVGVEFVESAARAFFEDLGVEPECIDRGACRAYRHGNIMIVVGDFFELTQAPIGKVDFVYDRAALVAVPPEWRKRYVEQLARLTERDSGLFLITFEHDIGSGPPFSVSDTESLLASTFALDLRASDDILQAESRFRERGASYMRELVWFARRL